MSKPLPVSWSSTVSFKVMKPGERIGYIDTTPPKTSFKLTAPGLSPLSAFQPRMPFECPTLASIHAANKLTLSVKMDERVWSSLNDLDNEFDKFLLDNSAKLFGAAEADYLRKNPGAISLKRAKRLAPIDPTGQPIYDSRLSLRISGRTMEVESVQTADGPRGSYVTNVLWSPRIDPLPLSATRFSKITGHTASDFQGNSMPIVRDTMPIFSLGDTAKVGAGHVRFIGPGDMASKCLIHHALIRPAYWTNVGGGFMITLALDHIIFENVEGDERGGAASDPHGHTRVLPDGFARDPHETGKPFEDMGGPSIGQPPPPKRRITIAPYTAAELTDERKEHSRRLAAMNAVIGAETTASIAAKGPSAASLAAGEGWDLEPPASRGITGGASSIGSSSFRALSRSATGATGNYDDEE